MPDIKLAAWLVGARETVLVEDLVSPPEAVKVSV